PTARAEGCRVGHRRREAQSRCPDLALADHDPARDARAFEVVLHAVGQLTPRVELTRPGACAFTTRGPSRYHGGDAALAARTAALVRQALGAAIDVAGPPGVGVADGRFTALLAARAAARQGGEPVVVAPGASAAFLARFPVVALTTDSDDADLAELVELLPRLGIRTLGALAALPGADVLARFGPVGHLAHRRAAGVDERMPNARRPPPELSVQMEFEPPVHDLGPLAFAAKQMAEQLHGRTHGLGLACTRLVVMAESEHGERHERVWQHEGALSAGAMAERARWQLDGWAQSAHPPTGGIVLVRLAPDEVVPDAGRPRVFGGARPRPDALAARAAARLIARHGPDAVTVVEWRGGRGPLERVARVSAGAVDLVERAEQGRAERAAVPTPPWPGALPAPAPASVHGQPRPARLHDATGNTITVNGRGALSASPRRLAIDATPGDEEVVAWAGPWLYDERWWDSAGHRRRARVQVLTASGSAHLLSLEGGIWRVEATYD
ncbi:MAG: protein ImuB, partial [Acidimicrobiaceae bacterium]|nr:protein ImuB [Acidimicrobiaceae bacterium]